MNDRFVAKRYVNIFLIVLMTFFYTLVFGIIHEMYWDEILSYICLDFVFVAIFILALERNRNEKKISGNRETDYKKIWIGFALSATIMLFASFLPEFLKPILFVVILMTGFGPSEIAVIVGIFLSTTTCLMLGSNIQELALYCLFTLFGGIFAERMKDKKAQIWYGVIIVCLLAMLPEVFYYLTYREVNHRIFLYGASEGLIIVIFVMLFYKQLVSAKETEIIDNLDEILDETYPLARELSSFSKTEYQHAKRVSKTARICAGLVGADEKTCAAAGFYYRIGIMEGGSMVENSIKIAQRECFPESVIRIISEYNGELALPSDIESAIVHMVDGLIKKLEVLEKQSMSSEWNQDMIIYQTLNEFSADGLYDKSGLSMNMFLKIREYLVNEEALL